jgi:hypothetical protein
LRAGLRVAGAGGAAGLRAGRRGSAFGIHKRHPLTETRSARVYARKQRLCVLARGRQRAEPRGARGPREVAVGQTPGRSRAFGIHKRHPLTETRSARVYARKQRLCALARSAERGAGARDQSGGEGMARRGAAGGAARSRGRRGAEPREAWHGAAVGWARGRGRHSASINAIRSQKHAVHAFMRANSVYARLARSRADARAHAMSAQRAAHRFARAVAARPCPLSASSRRRRAERSAPGRAVARPPIPRPS